MRSFRALLDVHDGQSESALASLTNALFVSQSNDAWSAFGLPEDEALRGLMRTYLALGQPRAALRLAERDAGLRLTGALELAHNEKEEATNDDESHAAQVNDANAHDEAEMNDATTDPSSTANTHTHATFQTLPVRLSARATLARVDLLSALSAAAEECGEFKRALEFERARFAALDNRADRRVSATRIAHLQAAQ